MKSPRAVLFAGLFPVAAGAALAEDAPSCRASTTRLVCGRDTVMKQGVMTLEDGTTKTMRFCIRLVARMARDRRSACYRSRQSQLWDEHNSRPDPVRVRRHS